MPRAPHAEQVPLDPAAVGIHSAGVHPTRSHNLLLVFAAVTMVSGCSHCAPDSPSPTPPEAQGPALPDASATLPPAAQPASCAVSSVTSAKPAHRFGHTTSRLGTRLLTVGGYVEHEGERCLVAATLDSVLPAGTLSEGRWGHTATAVEGRLLVAGGSRDDPELSPPRLAAAGWYDGSWVPAPQPAGRAWHSAVLWEHSVVLVGGRAGDSSSSSVEALDRGAAAWAALPDLPVPAFGAAVAALPAQLVVSGGAQGHGCGSDCAKDCYADEDCRRAAFCNRMSFCQSGQPGTWALTTPEGKWERLPVTSGAGATATVSGELIVVAGGYADGEASGEVWGIRGSSARKLATIVPRFHHTATALPAGRIVFAGGELLAPCTDPDCDRPMRVATTSVEVLDVATGTVSRAAPLQYARTGHTAALDIDGSILVIGGTDTDGRPAPSERLKF